MYIQKNMLVTSYHAHRYKQIKTPDCKHVTCYLSWFYRGITAYTLNVGQVLFVQLIFILPELHVPRKRHINTYFEIGIRKISQENELFFPI